ncbi:phosphatidylserine decarboxylase [Pyronema domesticum]|nr:phosphatidylserine decarboxylase [Pyronema domesticum]
MFSAVLTYIHAWLDYGLSCCKMAKNREIGWMTIDRKTGEYKREQQPIYKKLKLLILFNPLFEWIDRTRWFRHKLHEKAYMAGHDTSEPSSAAKIRSFVDFYHIDMNDFEPSDISQYHTFQDFFIRKHKPGTRPLYAEGDNSKAVVVADSRLVVYDTVSKACRIWIKGHHFNIENLVADEKSGHIWDSGSIASFRLSPQDYHRYHCPVAGTVKWWKPIVGEYYGVDPIAIRSDIDILTNNARCAVCIESEEFGQVLFVAIGASEVGTVLINEKFRTPGSKVEKGEELGMFEFGGSSIVVCFEQGRIKFDEDLIRASDRLLEMSVEMGTSLGTAQAGV